MKKSEMNRRHGLVTSRRCACLLAMAGMILEGYVTLARAEAVKPYVMAGITHDDNLFRLSDNVDPLSVIGRSSKADNYYRLEAGLDLTAQQARQKFNLLASVNQTRFERFTFLDNNGGAGHFSWDGALGNAWQARAGYDIARSLASFEVLTTGKNLRTDQRAYAEADYRIVPRLRVRAGVDKSYVRNSHETQRYLNYEEVSRALGLHYLSAAENYVGVQAKWTNGDYPNPENVDGTLVDNSFDETETGLVMDWRPAGHSRVQARASYTQRKYDQLPGRDYKGPTARFIYDWTLTAKTSLNLTAWRELTAADDLSASYVLSKAITVGPKWAATSKITIQAGLGHEKRDYQGDPRLILTSATERSDTLNSLLLTLAYAPTRKIQFGGAYETGRRTSTLNFADFHYNSVNLNLRVEF